MHDKVFISYAKEDYSFAEKLYQYLKTDFQPWLDKKNLYPGQNWNSFIQKNLREANFIILLLSTTSVEKRGYVQREFRTALEYVEDRLDEDIYLIPIKIDNCIVPERLSRFQWIEYNDSDAFELIATSIKIQQGKYLEYERKQIAAKQYFDYEERSNIIEHLAHFKTTIEIHYCQFRDISHPGLVYLNNLILGKVSEFIMGANGNHFKTVGFFEPWEGENDWNYSISYLPNLITKDIISINENVYSYVGGAHGNSGILGFNFNLHPFYQIELQDFFNSNQEEDVLKFISNYCYESLRSIYNEGFEISDFEMAEQTKDTLFNENSLTEEWENFSNFFISKSGLEIIFNTYTVSGYAFGIQTVLIPYNKFFEVLGDNTRLLKVFNKINEYPE